MKLESDDSYTIVINRSKPIQVTAGFIRVSGSDAGINLGVVSEKGIIYELFPSKSYCWRGKAREALLERLFEVPEAGVFNYRRAYRRLTSTELTALTFSRFESSLDYWDAQSNRTSNVDELEILLKEV